MSGDNHDWISGAIDGELSPGEEQALRQAMAGDEELRREFEATAALDRDLRAYADALAVEPRDVILPVGRPSRSRLQLAAGVAAALGLRVLLKLLPLLPALSLSLIVLALLLGCGLPYLLRRATGEQEAFDLAPMKGFPAP